MIIGNGAAAWEARLYRLSSRTLINNVGDALLETGEVIRKDAVESLDEGAILGPGHLPSAPGSPPNSDTRELALSGVVTELVEVADYIQTTVAFGGSRAPYAAAQELGFGNLPERPYERPATERARKTAPDRLREAVLKTVKG